MSPTQKPPTVSEVLSDLTTVATQVEEAKGRDSETINKGRACSRFADFVGENLELLKSLGVTNAETVQASVKEWAGIFAPQADLAWDKAEVAAKVNYLEALVPFGSLTDEQLATFESIKETLASASKGTGQRAERTPQERIEGRPQRVITSMGNDILSNQAGNLPNSVSNIKNAAVKKLNAALEKDGKTLTEEHANQIMAAVKNVVENGMPQATVLGITFAAAEESTD
jgi:hypothetical protein